MGRIVRILLLLPLVACGDRDEAEEGSVFKIGTAAGEVRIRVDDPGREPRRLLRYELAEGLEQRVAMEMRMTPDGIAVPMPAMRMEMRFGPSARTADGNLRVGFRLDAFKMLPGDENPERAAHLEPLLKDMVAGFSGTMVVTPSGCPLRAEFTLPESFPAPVRKMMDDMGKSMQQMPMVFPEEAVGVGARWEVDLPAEVMGLKLRQKASYTLREIEGDHGRIEFTLEQNGSGRIKMPGLAETSEARFDYLRSRGKGHMAFDLKQYVPRSEIEMRMEMKMTFKVGGEERTSESAVGMTLKMEPIGE